MPRGSEKHMAVLGSMKRADLCRRTRRRPLRFATFLAPNLFPFYAFVARFIGETLGCAVKLSQGSCYEQLAETDLAFVCGLVYVEVTRCRRPPVEPLAAPILQGERYGGKPVYFSDVIVRQDSIFRSFADLRGRLWAYNEPHSQSGYGVTRHHLIQLRETNGYFGKVVEAGWHELSIRMVCAGEVDAAAIDSHVLTVERSRRPELTSCLRVIDTLGPCPIQPVVASCRLSRSLKADVRDALLEMANDQRAKRRLRSAFVDRFTAVTDSAYDAIRTMLATAEAANFMTIK